MEEGLDIKSRTRIIIVIILMVIGIYNLNQNIKSKRLANHILNESIQQIHEGSKMVVENIDDIIEGGELDSTFFGELNYKDTSEENRVHQVLIGTNMVLEGHEQLKYFSEQLREHVMEEDSIAWLSFDTIHDISFMSIRDAYTDGEIYGMEEDSVAWISLDTIHDIIFRSFREPYTDDEILEQLGLIRGMMNEIQRSIQENSNETFEFKVSQDEWYEIFKDVERLSYSEDFNRLEEF